MDCVIVGLNDLCPVEAQDVVIAVQESLNDEAIDLKCYEEREAKQRESEQKEQEISSGDGFALHPQHPRCNSEQVSSSKKF